ncbi:glutamate receptor 3-like isoform X2 [Gigantopelta aegis]|uniref:glutamate receptor 3-like isoform X2 n=1 Tax=Gigantopelta aegis TaxID=1735272 RepID=UPI001B889C65|nr:glutamate receptor 3-like isoform X2 [Gigantopelta aegis]
MYKRIVSPETASKMMLVVILIAGTALTNAVEIPVGLLLDKNSGDLESAFDFAVQMMNRNGANLGGSTSRHRFFASTRNRTDMTDNYKVSSALCKMVESGVMAVIGVSNALIYNTIQSFSHALNVPYITASTSRAYSNGRYHYDITMSPPFIDAVIRLIEINHWPELYYVYDSDAGLWRLQQIYKHFQDKVFPRTIDVYKIRNISNSYGLLRGLDSKVFGIKRIILDLSSTESYKSILDQIIDVGMNRENYHYVLAGLGPMDLGDDYYSSFLFGGVNISAFGIIQRKMDTYKTWQILYSRHTSYYPNLFPLSTESALMIDATIAMFRSIPPLMDQGKLKLQRGRQVGIKCRGNFKSENGGVVRRSFVKARFSGLTGRVAFNETTAVRSEYTIDVHELRYKQPMQQTYSWTQKELNKPYTDWQIYGNDTCANCTQRVTTFLVSPFVMRKKNTNGAPPVDPTHSLEGYCVDLIAMIAERAHFEFSIKLADDYGKKHDNGTWTGMIGELVRGKSDIAVSALTITEERERVVDFTKPFMNTGISIMIKKPDKVKPGVFSFMEPLDRYVWLCIGVGFLGVSFVLFFVGRFSPFEWNINDGENKEEAMSTFTISNTMWFSLGALMQQGSDISPRSVSGRIIGSAWWFFTLIIISSYTANLAAFLTIEKMVTPIDSADDLVKQSNIKYGTLKTGTTWSFFEKSAVVVFRTMAEVMKESPDVLMDTVEAGVDKVRKSKSKYAFMLESAMNDFHNQQEPCDTMKVGDNLDNKGYGIATRLLYPMRSQINIAVLELREIGELHKLQQKWWIDKGKCGDQDSGKDATQSALTLSNVSGIFHILIGGLVLAMITSSLEYLAQKKIKEKKNKKKRKKPLPPPPPPNPPRRENFETFNTSAAYSPEHENGGYNFPPAGQLVTFESQPTSSHTEI